MFEKKARAGQIEIISKPLVANTLSRDNCRAGLLLLGRRYHFLFAVSFTLDVRSRVQEPLGIATDRRRSSYRCT